MDKIVITGMGAVTPIGIGVDTYWNNLIEGKSGIDIIKSFDASELAVQIAGEVKDFNPSDWLPKDVVRKTDAFMQYAYIAAEEALKQSGVEMPLLRKLSQARLTRRSDPDLFPKSSATSRRRTSQSLTISRVPATLFRQRAARAVTQSIRRLCS